MNRRHSRQPWTVLALLLALPWPVPAADEPAVAANRAIYAAMWARRSKVAAALKGDQACVGQGLDGLLVLNDPPECARLRGLVEEENADRKRLAEGSATKSNGSAGALPADMRDWYQKRLQPGDWRQVRLAREPTPVWWNGRPPHPDDTAVPRVLSLGGARIMVAHDPGSPVLRDGLQPFESFGVVSTWPPGNAVPRWYELALRNPDGGTRTGWLAAAQAIPWPQAIAMRFVNSAGREPSLFFAGADPLVDLMALPKGERATRVRDVLAGFRQGAPNPDLIAVEPRVGPAGDALYPVLSFDPGGRGTTIDGVAAHALEVASIVPVPSQVAGSPDIRVDYLFVMDTTESMAPYLDALRAAIRDFASGASDDAVRFGFVAYRDANRKDSTVSFPFREHLYTPDELRDAHAFLSILQSDINAQQAVVRGDDFREALFEGLSLALGKSIPWRDGAVKVILLIGDAPGREHPGRASRVAALRRQASQYDVNLVTFHVKNTHVKNTKVSRRIDGEANRQFRDLASFGRLPVVERTPYADEPSRESRRFFFSIDASGQLQNQLSRALTQASAAVRDLKTAGRPGSNAGDPMYDLVFQHAALQLANPADTRPWVRGWATDKVLTDPQQSALYPVVLLTDSELDSLINAVQQLIDAGESAGRGGQGSPDPADFFDLVARTTQWTMVKPGEVEFRDRFRIPLGIDRLPYKSDVLYKTRDDFRDASQLREFVATLKSKLEVYRGLKARRHQSGIWHKLHQNAEESDRVVALDLRHLP